MAHFGQHIHAGQNKPKNRGLEDHIPPAYSFVFISEETMTNF